MDDFFEALEKAAYAKKAEGVGTLSPLSSEIPNVRQPTTAPPAHPITPMTSPRPTPATKPSSPFGVKPPTPTRPPAAASPMAAPTSDWTQHLGALGPALAMGAAPMIGQVAGLPGLMAAWNFLGGRGGQDFQTIFGAPPVSAPPPSAAVAPRPAPRPAPPVSAPTPQPTPPPAPAPTPAPQPQPSPPQPTPPAAAPTPAAQTPPPQPRPEPFSLGPVGDFAAGQGLWMAAPEVASRGLQRVAPGAASRVMPGGGGIGADMAVQLGLVGPLTDLADRSEGFGNLPGVGRQSWFGRNVLGLQPQTPLNTRSIDDMARQDFGTSFSHGPGAAPGNSFIAPSEPSLRDPINYPANWLFQRFPYATRPITTGEWGAESLGQFGQAMGNREAVASRAQSQGLMGNPNIPTHPSPYIFEPGPNGAMPQRRSLGSYLGNLWNQSVEQGPHVAAGDQLARGVDNWNEVLTNRHLARQQHPGAYPEETGERFARDVFTNGPAGLSNYWNGTAYIPGTRNLHLPAINPARWGEQWGASVPWWLGGDR